MKYFVPWKNVTNSQTGSSWGGFRDNGDLQHPPTRTSIGAPYSCGDALGHHLSSFATSAPAAPHFLFQSKECTGQRLATYQITKDSIWQAASGLKRSWAVAFIWGRDTVVGA